jgi:hypothetical protein
MTCAFLNFLTCGQGTRRDGKAEGSYYLYFNFKRRKDIIKEAKPNALIELHVQTRPKA